MASSSPGVQLPGDPAAKEISVKKYVVKLTGDERRHLHELIRTGKHSAQLLMKARILLKADTSSAGDGWSDSQIVRRWKRASPRVRRMRSNNRRRGLRSGADAQASGTSARARIFDGEKEAKLIALACSAPPRGRAKWTLRLLEDKVVELNIVERAER